MSQKGEKYARRMERRVDKLEQDVAAITTEQTTQGVRISAVEDALAVAETVGYPVLLKASAGGGGRGIRRCDSAQDLPDAYAAAMKV